MYLLYVVGSRQDFTLHERINIVGKQMVKS